MRDFVLVTGLVLKTGNLGEYDKRMVILTRERGKITAFARGARRQNSRLMAASNPFSFGEFKLYEGKNAYNLIEANITNYFEELRTDLEGICYGTYFMEIADYYARENNDEVELLKLLYQTLRALSNKNLNDRLIRCIYEIRMLVVNGEFPGIPEKKNWSATACYSVDYMARSPIEKLYTFTVSEEVLTELREIAFFYCTHYMEGQYKSLLLLQEMYD